MMSRVAPPPLKALTGEQAEFCRLYLESGNAVEAYRAAYPGRDGSDAQVKRLAAGLLAQRLVSDRIAELSRAHLARHVVTVDRVIEEYRRLAFLDVRKAFDVEGNLRPLHELDNDTAAAVAGLEVEDVYEGRGQERRVVGRVRKVKITDKIRALDSLAKHLGMFIERAEITGAGGGPIQIAAGMTDEQLQARLTEMLAGSGGGGA